MIYARQPTQEELEELRRMRRREIGRVSQRAHMVLMSIEPQSVPEIAAVFQVCRANVRYWLKRFNQEGPAGLYDEPRSGRPRKVTGEVKGKVIELLQDDPQQDG